LNLAGTGQLAQSSWPYVPVDSGEARWVKLHYVIIENKLEFPSLRSAFMRDVRAGTKHSGSQAPLPLSTSTAAACTLMAATGAPSRLVAQRWTWQRTLTATARTILGLQVKGTINDVDNQKASVSRVELAAFCFSARSS
jgi:hypothetical protein